MAEPKRRGTLAERLAARTSSTPPPPPAAPATGTPTGDDSGPEESPHGRAAGSTAGAGPADAAAGQAEATAKAEARAEIQTQRLARLQAEAEAVRQAEVARQAAADREAQAAIAAAADRDAEVRRQADAEAAAKLEAERQLEAERRIEAEHRLGAERSAAAAAKAQAEAELEAAAAAAAAAREAAAQARADAERAREEAKAQTAAQAKAREQAEARAREETEQARTETEQARADAAEARADAEQARAEARQAQAEAEQARAEAEQARAEAEKSLAQARAQAAAQAEKAAEAARADAAAARAQAEAASAEAAAARVEPESPATADLAWPATPGGTATALLRPPPRGVGRRLLAEPGQRLTEREPRDVLRLAVSATRVVGLASSALLAAFGDRSPSNLPWLLAIAVAITLYRLWQPARGTTDHLVETGVVAVLLVAGDGMMGPFALFAAATALAAGADAGIGIGLLSGTVLASAAVGGASEVRQGGFDASLIGSWLVLHPLTASLGALAARVLDVDDDGRTTLVDVNRVLRSLHNVAHDAPATLQASTVAQAVAGELRETAQADVAIVMATRGDALVELGRAGTAAGVGHLLLAEDWQALVPQHSGTAAPLTTLPPRLRAALGAFEWQAISLVNQDRLVGVVLLSGVDREPTRPARIELRHVASDTAVALDNASLFSQIEQLAAATERARIADDLHDGVAQQLTHVRFELELLGRQSRSPQVRKELARLAGVAHHATDDVRSSIRGLRANAVGGGLGPALQSLVADLDGASGPELILDVRSPSELDPDVEAEVFRIIQEAVSNSMRHAAADHLLIEVDEADGVLMVAIEDDGVGLEATVDDPSDGDGLGLLTMQARAQRIGATLTVAGNELGGVRVELQVPTTGHPGLDDQED